MGGAGRTICPGSEDGPLWNGRHQAALNVVQTKLLRGKERKARQNLAVFTSTYSAGTDVSPRLGRFFIREMGVQASRVLLEMCRRLAESWLSRGPPRVWCTREDSIQLPSFCAVRMVSRLRFIASSTSASDESSKERRAEQGCKKMKASSTTHPLQVSLVDITTRPQNLINKKQL